jgi:ribokinase
VTGRVFVVGSLQQWVVADVIGIPGAGEIATSLRTRRRLGGGAVTQALAARTAGAAVVLVAAVGDDEIGRWCHQEVAAAGIEPRLQVLVGDATAQAVVAREDGDRDAVVLLPVASERLDGVAALNAAEPGDVVLVQLDVPAAVATDVVREADRWDLRVVVNAAPFATLDPEVAALADPVVVGERDAAVLADVGVIPESLCVRFGRAGAVWDDLRVDSDDLGAPAPEHTEVFCGTLAAALAAVTTG